MPSMPPTSCASARWGGSARLLGLGPAASAAEIADAAAARTGFDRGAVRGILIDDVPRTDAELVALDRRLRALEQAVARAAARTTSVPKGTPDDRPDPDTRARGGVRHRRCRAARGDEPRPNRGRQGRGRPGRHRDGTADRPARARPRAAGGRPGRRQDPARALVQRRARARHEAHPVHARPDAGRRVRVARLRRARRRVRVPRGAGVHEHRARRRDQPHAAEDAVRAAGGDGRAPGLDRRRHPPAARPVPGRRDAEPDRARGHLHAPRGAARPIPAQARRRDARPRRRARRAPPSRGRVRSPRTSARRGCARSSPPTRSAPRSAPRHPSRSPTTCSATSSTSPGRPGAARRCSSASSPRASTALLAAAKAWAWLGGYPAITPDHVQTMLVPTWRHRIRLRPDAELEGVSVDASSASVVQQTRVPI